jgi:DNA-binding CsgD family transcriptional regulator
MLNAVIILALRYTQEHVARTNAREAAAMGQLLDAGWDEAPQLHVDDLAQELAKAVLMPELLPGVMHWLTAYLAAPAEAIEEAELDLPDSPGDETSKCQGADHPWQRVLGVLTRCRSLRSELQKHGQDRHNASNVAAMVLDPDGRIIDHNRLGSALLQAGDVVTAKGEELVCVDPGTQRKLVEAMRETLESGRSSNLLLVGRREEDRRFCLTLCRVRPNGLAHPRSAPPRLLCLVSPLDRRRIATVRQLMDLFGLSASEARLARALASGESVSEYCSNHDLRAPTVRTQLRAVFSKTGVDRQVGLVRMIMGIPAVRDAS